MPGGEPLLLGHAREQAIGLLRLDRHRANGAAAVPGEDLPRHHRQNPQCGRRGSRAHGEIVPRCTGWPVGPECRSPVRGEISGPGVWRNRFYAGCARMNGLPITPPRPGRGGRERQAAPGSAGHTSAPTCRRGTEQVSDQPREAGSARARLAPELSSLSTSLRLVATASMSEERVGAPTISGGPHPGFRAVTPRAPSVRASSPRRPRRSTSRAAHLQGDPVETTVRFQTPAATRELRMPTCL
jgi:hypothetical protein